MRWRDTRGLFQLASSTVVEPLAPPTSCDELVNKGYLLFLAEVGRKIQQTCRGAPSWNVYSREQKLLWREGGWNIFPPLQEAHHTMSSCFSRDETFFFSLIFLCGHLVCLGNIFAKQLWRFFCQVKCESACLALPRREAEGGRFNVTSQTLCAQLEVSRDGAGRNMAKPWLEGMIASISVPNAAPRMSSGWTHHEILNLRDTGVLSLQSASLKMLPEPKEQPKS